MRGLAQACRLLREITPDEQVTDCFLLRYDIVNLKALFKARMLGTKDVLLSDNGLIEPETLRRCVGEGKYAALGEEMRPALEEVERQASRWRRTRCLSTRAWTGCCLR